MKVANDLGQHGFIETICGRGGGLRLARLAARIGLGEVVRKMEGDFTMVECFAPESNHCRICGPCRLQDILRDALKAYIAVLDEYTLADLTGRNPRLSKLLLAV